MNEEQTGVKSRIRRWIIKRLNWFFRNEILLKKKNSSFKRVPPYLREIAEVQEDSALRVRFGKGFLDAQPAHLVCLFPVVPLRPSVLLDQIRPLWFFQFHLFAFWQRSLPGASLRSRNIRIPLLPLLDIDWTRRRNITRAFVIFFIWPFCGRSDYGDCLVIVLCFVIFSVHLCYLLCIVVINVCDYYYHCDD